MKLGLDWVSLPKLLNWTFNQSDPQLDITIAVVFKQRYAIRVTQSYMWEAQHEVMMKLCKVSNMGQRLACLAD